MNVSATEPILRQMALEVYNTFLNKGISQRGMFLFVRIEAQLFKLPEMGAFSRFPPLEVFLPAHILKNVEENLLEPSCTMFDRAMNEVRSAVAPTALQFAQVVSVPSEIPEHIKHIIRVAYPDFKIPGE